MPTYKLVALAVFVLTIGSFGTWQFLIRRAQSRFFDPGIDHAEQALTSFARQVHGRFVPSKKRWSELSPWINNNFRARNRDRRRAKVYPGDGAVELTRDGFPTKVGWVVVALEDGFALLPLVRVDLPLGVSFAGLHGASSGLLDNPWDLWTKNVYDVSERRPSFQLTAPERQAFDALSPRACRIFMLATVAGNPITGALPNPYALYVEVWGAPFHGEHSPRPLESDVAGWREDFDQEELATLVDLTVAFAKAAAPRR